VIDGADSGPVLFRAALVHELLGHPDMALRFAALAIEARHPPLLRRQHDTAMRILADA
jgi:hypothetical protein